jgi:hypothetical protein
VTMNDQIQSVSIAGSSVVVFHLQPDTAAVLTESLL